MLVSFFNYLIVGFNLLSDVCIMVDLFSLFVIFLGGMFYGVGVIGDFFYFLEVGFGIFVLLYVVFNGGICYDMVFILIIV